MGKQSLEDIKAALACKLITLEQALKLKRGLDSDSIRTFRTDRLYHQFLKPKNIELEKLPFLVTKLYEAQFIELYQNLGDYERYSETEKLTGREHRDELFKIVQELKT